MAVLFLIFAGLLWRSALEEIRPKIPPAFRDEYQIRFALDGFIWERSMPVRARRKYILSQACISAASATMGLFMLFEGPLAAVVAFFAVSFLLAVLTFLRWFKYRDRF
jgi:hypothetical protein